MRSAILILLTFTAAATAEIPAVPKSISPDGKMRAVLDVDRDPNLSPEWKEDSFPQIEITRTDTGKVMASVGYFGSPGDDARPLREHVQVSWRPDSKAFAVTVNDRFYSSTLVYALNEESKFVEVSFPSYKEMTGFPPPDSKHLRSRGRATVKDWDKDGHLIYDLFSSPMVSFMGKDPLIHRIYLKVSATRMVPLRVEHEEGEWRNGDWIKTRPPRGADNQRPAQEEPEAK